MPQHSHLPFEYQKHETNSSISVSSMCCSVSIEQYSTPSDYETTIKSLHTKTVSDSNSLLSYNRVLQTVSSQIAPEEANLTRLYRIIISQLRSFFCSYLYSHRENIGLIPSPLCTSCGLELQ